mmetsp:Transcript_3204/g.5347  ORF Transcript_3204/g.5347 Transcript_3204/m.5347 type:complete len:149 (-) Transcript_3204:478-924(-)
MLIDKGEIKEVFFDEHFSTHIRRVPMYRKIKRMSKFVDLDSIYFQFAETIYTNDTKIIKEPLSNLTDFGEFNYMPILDPRNNSNYSSVDYFRSPNDPYLVFEQIFDHITQTKDAKHLLFNQEKRIDRRVRRSDLMHSDHDHMKEYLYL